MVTFTQICGQIQALLQEKETVLVAIDGNCTAGKTTLAAKLAQVFPCNVFHMDDFFLQSHQRTPERFSEPGGNVDYRRFHRDVILPLTRQEAVSFQPYDCQTASLQPHVDMPWHQLNIIEGTYSCHPFFGQPYDLTVFLSVSEDVQRQRILQRPQMLHQKFFTAWIPMEQAYFDTFSIADGCHLRCIGQEELWD